MFWLDLGGIQYFKESEVVPFLDLTRERERVLRAVSEITIGGAQENSNVTIELINEGLTQRFAQPPIDAVLYEVLAGQSASVFSGRLVSVSIGSIIQLGIES